MLAKSGSRFKRTTPYSQIQRHIWAQPCLSNDAVALLRLYVPHVIKYLDKHDAATS